MGFGSVGVGWVDHVTRSARAAKLWGLVKPWAVPVALIHTSVAALIAPGADRLGGLGLDQLLEHQAHRAADQLRAAAGAKRLPQLCRVSIRKGHQCVLLDE